MPRKERFTVNRVIAALQRNKGMVYLTAKELGCTPQTLYDFCKRHPSAEAAKQYERGEMLDAAELKLWQSVQKGEAWGISLALKTIGKDRGYVERTETTGKDGGPLELEMHLKGARDRLQQRLAHLAAREAENHSNGH